MEEVALFFHLLGAFLFVAGFVLTGIAFERARRRERPEEVASSWPSAGQGSCSWAWAAC